MDWSIAALRAFALAFLLVTFPDTSVSAQDLGIRGGLSISELADEQFPESINARPGLVIGGYGTAFFNERWILQPEILYVQRGSNQDFISNDTAYQLRSALIDVPILMRYQLPEYYIGEPYFILGPHFSLLREALFRMKKDNEEVEVSNAFNGLDYGLTAGMGLYFSDHVILDLRLTYGLGAPTDADPQLDREPPFSVPDFSDRNRVSFLATMAYNFTIFRDRNPEF